MSPPRTEQVRFNCNELRDFVAQIFVRLGVLDADARLVAHALVAADMDGVPSHGIGLVPLYAMRIRAGSVAPRAIPQIVEDHGGLVVMSAGHGLGQVSAQAAVALASERACEHGTAAVAVRHAFHFGTAAYWAAQFATLGMIGFAFSNTRPLMPSPGGAERVVGNNPLAIAFPAGPGEPVIVDMATSASAMGRIRIAAKHEEPIPAGWATDSLGRPTTSAADAIEGMLLPAAGPKGFGLAVAIELLCGALSGGAVGAAVRPLYDRLREPYDCSHAFLAIDASRLHGGKGVTPAAREFQGAIRASKLAPGTERVYAPGDLERERHAAHASLCPIAAHGLDELASLAAELGLAAPAPH